MSFQDATMDTDKQREDWRTQSEAPLLYVVDDDVSTLQLLAEVAQDVGFRPRAFTALEPLRNALHEDPPAMVIVDDDLPDGRGGDLARDIRRDPRLEDIPLIVCTAATEQRQAEISRWAPVVPKPFALGQIEDALAEAVRRTPARRHRGGRRARLDECAPSSSRMSFLPRSTGGPASTSTS